MQMRRCACEKRGLVGGGPNTVAARVTIESAAVCAWVGVNKPSVETPGQSAGEHGPSVIGLPTLGGGGDVVAPCQKDTARATVGQCREREIAEIFLDEPDAPDITTARDVGEASELAARLVGL